MKKCVEIKFYNGLTKILEDLGTKIRKKISFVTEDGELGDEGTGRLGDWGKFTINDRQADIRR